MKKLIAEYLMILKYKLKFDKMYFFFFMISSEMNHQKNI